MLKTEIYFASSNKYNWFSHGFRPCFSFTDDFNDISDYNYKKKLKLNINLKFFFIIIIRI